MSNRYPDKVLIFSTTLLIALGSIYFDNNIAASSKPSPNCALFHDAFDGTVIKIVNFPEHEFCKIHIETFLKDTIILDYSHKRPGKLKKRTLDICVGTRIRKDYDSFEYVYTIPGLEQRWGTIEAWCPDKE
jgi:hypothetical protein